MAELKASKVVNSLPGSLDANTMYFVRVGAGFDIYVTNSSGTVVAYSLNAAIKKTDFVEVPDYATMLALPGVSVLTEIKVATDEHKGQLDTIYQVWPSGRRKWIAAADDN